MPDITLTQLVGIFRVAADHSSVAQAMPVGTRLVIGVPPIFSGNQLLLPSSLGDRITVIWDGAVWRFQPHPEFAPSPSTVHLLASVYPYTLTMVRPDGSSVGPFSVTVSTAGSIDVSTLTTSSEATLNPQDYVSTLDALLPVIKATTVITDAGLSYLESRSDGLTYVSLLGNLAGERLRLAAGHFARFVSDDPGLMVQQPTDPRYASLPPLATGLLLDGYRPTAPGYPTTMTVAVEPSLRLVDNLLTRHADYGDPGSLSNALNQLQALYDAQVIVAETDGHWSVYPTINLGGAVMLRSGVPTARTLALATLVTLRAWEETSDSLWRTRALGLLKTLLSGLSWSYTTTTPAWNAALAGLPYAQWLPGNATPTSSPTLDGFAIAEVTLTLVEAERILNVLKEPKLFTLGVLSGDITDLSGLAHFLFTDLTRLWTSFKTLIAPGGAAYSAALKLPYTHHSLDATGVVTFAYSDEYAIGLPCWTPWRVAKMTYAQAVAWQAGVNVPHPLPFVARLYAKTSGPHRWTQARLLDETSLTVNRLLVDAKATAYVGLARMRGQMAQVSRAVIGL